MSPAPVPEPEVKHLVASTLRFIAIRNRSTAEVIQYVNRKSASNQALSQAVIQKISDFNLLNDAAFADQWVAMRLRHAKGPKIITQELKLKGVDPQQIAASLAKTNQSQWQESAAALLVKKWPSVKSLTFQEKAKMSQYLYRRGFEPGVIHAVIDARRG